MESSIALITAVVTFLGVPVLAPFLAGYIYRKSTNVKKQTYFGAVLFILLVFVGVKLSISFTSFLANSIVISLAYACFGFLALSLFRLKPKSIGIVLGVLSSIPLVLGVLLTTIGFLGLAFITADYRTTYEAKLPSGLKCLVSTTGNATAAGGNDVRLYKQIIWGVEYRAAKKYYAEDDPKPEPYLSHQSACHRLDATYGLTHHSSGTPNGAP
jgi:hypothetical protein